MIQLIVSKMVNYSVESAPLVNFNINGIADLDRAIAVLLKVYIGCFSSSIKKYRNFICARNISYLWLVRLGYLQKILKMCPLEVLTLLHTVS